MSNCAFAPTPESWDLSYYFVMDDQINEFFDKLATLEPGKREKALSEIMARAVAMGRKEENRFESIKAEYTPFPQGQKLTVETITNHLKEQLGNDLTYFGADEDRIYLNELRKIEPMAKNMEDKLIYEHGKTPDNVPLIKDIVPTVSVRVTNELEALSEKEFRNIERLAVLGRARKRTQNKEQVPAIG